MYVAPLHVPHICMFKGCGEAYGTTYTVLAAFHCLWSFTLDGRLPFLLEPNGMNVPVCRRHIHLDFVFIAILFRSESTVRIPTTRRVGAHLE